MLAVSTVEEMTSKVPTNKNGYPLDGFKAPTFTEKIEAIERLANFLWEPEPEMATLEEVTSAAREAESYRD